MSLLLEQNQGLSVYYFITNLFSTIPSITVTDEFPLTDLSLPSVSVVADEIELTAFELGNRYGKRQRMWSINTFGNSKDQRDLMSITILNQLEEGIPVYDYNYGFPPSASPPLIGALNLLPNTLVVSPIRIFPELTERLYWRTSIKFMTEYESI